MIKLDWGDLAREVVADIEHDVEHVMADKKTVEPLAKEMRRATRDWIDSQGGGSWTPFAQSTLEKREQTGTSNVTKFGKIRQSKLRAVEKKLKALTARTSKGGWGEGDRKQAARLRRRLDFLRREVVKPQETADKMNAKAKTLEARAAELTEQVRELHRQPNKRGREAKIQRKQAQLEKLDKQIKQADTSAKWAEIGTTFKGRDAGKRVSETTKMMPRMAGTVRVKASTPEPGVISLTTYSRSGIVGQAHDKGLGNDPKRQIIPDPTEDQINMGVELIMAALTGKME